MATSVSKKRLSRHELKEDKLMTALGGAATFVQARRSTALVLVVGIVAAIAVVVLYKSAAKSGAVRSEELLYLAMNDYEAGRFREAANGLGQFTERFPRHARASVALTALGNAHLMLGERDEAAAKFERAASVAARGSDVWVAATSGLGAVASAKGLMEDAARHYAEAADGAHSKEAGAEAIISAISANIAARKLDAARALLDRAKKDFGETRASQNLGRVEGELAATGG